jgi:hypothetical protein
MATWRWPQWRSWPRSAWSAWRPEHPGVGRHAAGGHRFRPAGLTGAALFYLVSSTLALCALFLLAELIERSRSANEAPLDEEEDAMPSPLESLHPPKASTSTTSRR